MAFSRRNERFPSYTVDVRVQVAHIRQKRMRGQARLATQAVAATMRGPSSARALSGGQRSRFAASSAAPHSTAARLSGRFRQVAKAPHPERDVRVHTRQHHLRVPGFVHSRDGHTDGGSAKQACPPQSVSMLVKQFIQCLPGARTGRGRKQFFEPERPAGPLLEVRKLAERTTQATTDIARMIDAIQDSSRAAVSAMRSAVEDVGGGVGMAEQAGSAIVQIKDGAERVVNVVANNSSALVEQGVASEGIAVQVEQVAQMTEQNSEAASVVATAAEVLMELAIVMKVPGSRFQIG